MRCAVQLFWCEGLACFRGKSASLVIHYSNVSNIFLLPLSPTEKKSLLVLSLAAPVPYMRSTVHQGVVSIPDADKLTVDKPVAPLPER